MSKYSEKLQGIWDKTHYIDLEDSQWEAYRCLDGQPVYSIAWGAATRLERLNKALTNLLERYVDLVNSGDCGHWNPHKEDVVIFAKDALALDCDTIKTAPRSEK